MNWKQMPVPEPIASSKIETDKSCHILQMQDGFLTAIIGHSEQHGWHISLSHSKGRFPTFLEAEETLRLLPDVHLTFVFPRKFVKRPWPVIHAWDSKAIKTFDAELRAW